jgi:tRNA(Ile)-lysidine synthase
MKKIEQKVLKFIDEKNLIEKNDKVLVGLSGGPDSVFLLHFLKKYSKKLKISLGAVHVNHLLRGKEANRDERFCEKLSNELSIPFYSVRKNIKAKASKEKISIEEAGRKIRYKEFEKVLVKEGYTKIATAHNADENTETVLLNLVKGTGLSGLSGIPPLRNNIIRPLLVITKKEVLDYLDHYNLKYRTDLTNLIDDSERNFLRNQVIPLIKKRLNPSLANTLLKSSEVFRNINNLIKKKADGAAINLVSKKENYLSISLPQLKKIEVGFRSEVIRYIFNKEFGMQISFDDCTKVLSLLNKQVGKSIQIFENIKVTRERIGLIIHKEKIEKEINIFTINLEDTIRINDKKLSIKESGTIKEVAGSNRNLEFISGDNTSDDFLVRRWISGDRFFPFGMRGSKKVSDFLNEQKISSLKKKKQMILLNQNRIVWVIGLRLDERFRITSETKRVFQLCLL